MDINNVLEGTRRYFMGLPKPAEESGQPAWPAGAAPAEEGAPVQAGAPAHGSRPPSAAPPRPPSEPLEPEPHIIHKATVMREAAEKRRELKEPDDEEEASSVLSPPSHIIHKPRGIVSPAPAPAAPSPSPARPPSAAPVADQVPTHSQHYRSSVPIVQTSMSHPNENFAPGRPPDPYSTSRPPEHYSRYSYESIESGRRSQGPHIGSSPLPTQTRHSPQTYARSSNAMPQHGSSRLREMAAPSPQAQQRYIIPTPPNVPPPNDRVPPIHHPQMVQPNQRPTPMDARQAPLYTSQQQRRDVMPYTRPGPQYERHSTVPPRKYDHQQAYSGYRQTTTTSQQPQLHRMESHQQIQNYKRPALESVPSHYARPDRSTLPQHYAAEVSRIPARVDYHATRTSDVRSGYPYPTASASTSTMTSKVPQRPVAVPKTNYEYTNHVATSPARPTIKSGYSNQQARMTVSVTTLVNQMNQTKQKRESPLDLSVKTVKNSADSSTTQDEIVDSMSMSVESSKPMLQPRSLSGSRNIPQPGVAHTGSHKVDFAPDFNQYRERNVTQVLPAIAQPNQPPVRYNGSYETQRPCVEPCLESRSQAHSDRYKYNPHVGRPDHVPRIDLTKSDERIPNNRIRDDRNLIIEDRKRPGGPVVSHIPEKIVRYETWSADSRTDRLSQSAREQHELMSRPVYSYRSHKQFEAYQNEQKRAIPPPAVYSEHYPHTNHRHHGMVYPPEMAARESREYHTQYQERISSSSSNNRHVIQKTPSQRDLNHHPLEYHNGVPADKRVLSILRNSLETKQTSLDTARPVKHVPELIVIDDADDSEVIEITDLTRDNESERNQPQTNVPKRHTQNLDHHIRMPRAVDSIARENDNPKTEYSEIKSKSPENDVAARIRTKAELKVMPPSQDSTIAENKQMNSTDNVQIKIVPKSQKQHLFNQIRQDNLRLESVIKTETSFEASVITEVKSEPMNIEEIERDAAVLLKTETVSYEPESLQLELAENPEEDSFWASTCDSFMEQLKTGVHKKKTRKRVDTIDKETDSKTLNIPPKSPPMIDDIDQTSPSILSIKQEPIDEDDIINKNEQNDSSLKEEIDQTSDVSPEIVSKIKQDINENTSNLIDKDVKFLTKNEEIDPDVPKNTPKDPEKTSKRNEVENNKVDRKSRENKQFRNKSNDKDKLSKLKSSNKRESKLKNKMFSKSKIKSEISDNTPLTKKENKDTLKPQIKEESESTDDDVPLIKSKLLKEKEKSDLLKFQLLRDLSEKSAYVKLECFEVDMNKNTRISIDSLKDEKPIKGKLTRQSSRFKKKSINSSVENTKPEKQNNSSGSDTDDDMTVASRLRVRKNIKTEDSKTVSVNKVCSKLSMSKKQENNSASSSSTLVRKPPFGDGSYFHPGWEEELYKYKRSLRMPPRLIAIPRGRSGGPAFRGPGGSFFNRVSTSLPDLDPAPLSPAPSSAPSAATDDLYSRRPEKLNIDSDVESNSSYSTPYKLHYDSEASTSTILSTSKFKRKSSSIVDVLMQKCGKRDEMLKKKNKEKEEKFSKTEPKNSVDIGPESCTNNSSNKENLCKKETASNDIFELGEIKKEVITEQNKSTPKNVLSKSKTEGKTHKHRASIKEVFGDERPASAPPSSLRDDDSQETEEEPLAKIKKEVEAKTKFKTKKMLKDSIKRKLSATRDGLRSSNLKRNDAKGRMLRLKKRNSIMQSLAAKRIREISASKNKSEKHTITGDMEKPKENEIPNSAEGIVKKRFKRIIGRRKFSSGFDYIRKKKKLPRKEETNNKIVRRPAPKPEPESVHDIHKEIKGWFINKSVGETHLHRAARLGYTDCVAYCLEKMEADPSAKDNAGFTPLHVAAARGYVRIARILLQYGANVSAAAQGGIRPLHEASENCHVEVIRLLLSYGADPVLGTYAGQTPEELAEGTAAKFLRLYIGDVQGKSTEPWRFPPPTEILDYEELGCDPLSSPPPASPPPPPDSTIEIQSTDAPLPPFYTLRTIPGQTSDGLWCLLQDITNILQIKSKDSLLKQIHCGSGSPKELFREIRTQEFLERAQCHQLLCAGEKVNVRASKVALVRVTDKLRQLLKIETVLVS